MSTHTPTPGPWRYGVVEDRDFRAVEADEFYIAGPDDECPATVWGGKSYPRGEANARLIASAPDLLTAAIEAMAVMDDIWDTKDADDEFIYDEMGSSLSAGYFSLRAAIAKATGATP